VVLVVAGTALLGCSDDADSAAVVNGTEISHQEVVDTLEAIEGNEDFLAAYEGSGRVVRGSRPGTFDAAFAAEVLNLRINHVLVADEIEERGLDLDDACRQAARRDLAGRLGGGDPDLGETLLDEFPEGFRDYLLEDNANQLVLQADLLGLACVEGDPNRAFFDAHPDELRQACVSIITVPDQATAEVARAELDAGAGFAAVAAARSIDARAAEGGDQGCVLRHVFEPGLTDLGRAVFDATTGEVGGPVASPDGVHLFLVREFRQPTFDEVADDVAPLLVDALNEAFDEWRVTAVGEADVVVDERYGRWDPLTGTIVPPDAPPTTGTGDGSDPPSSTGP
jgi:hypothetical protein